MHIETLTALTPELTESFLVLYRESFAGMEKRAAARQSLTDDEFRHDMTNPSVKKWVCWVGETAAALAFMTTDLELLPWISPAYYAERFPDHDRRGAIHYFGGVVVHPDHRRGAVARKIIARAVQDAAKQEAIVAFDCCAFNVDTVRLPEMIARIGGRVATVVPHEIDVQRYYAYEIKEAV